MHLCINTVLSFFDTPCRCLPFCCIVVTTSSSYGIVCYSVFCWICFIQLLDKSIILDLQKYKTVSVVSVIAGHLQM